jgi:hypothetical protein
MINFVNERDKILLENLINLPVENSCIADYMAICILNNRAIIIYPEDNKLQLVTENKSDNKVFIDDLLNFISLIEYLRRNNLIFIHKNPEIHIQPTIVLPDGNLKKSVLNKIDNFERRVAENMNQFHFTFINTIFGYINEYISSFIYVRSELKDYVKNNFSSIEDRRFRKTIFWTRLAAGISFLGLITAIMLSTFIKTKIDSSQFNIIKESLQQKKAQDFYNTNKSDTIKEVRLKDIK